MLYKIQNNSASILLKVKAASKIDSIDKFVDIEGENYLKIFTKAIPENGKANKAILKLLSKSWKIPAKNLEITSGLTSNNKILSIKNISEEALKDIFAPYINSK